jgi:hypothetical protein
MDTDLTFIAVDGRAVSTSSVETRVLGVDRNADLSVELLLETLDPTTPNDVYVFRGSEASRFWTWLNEAATTVA